MSIGNLVNYKDWANFGQNLTATDSAGQTGFFLENELTYNLKRIFEPLYAYTFSRDCEQINIPNGIQTTAIFKAEYRGVGGVSTSSIDIHANGATAIPAQEITNTRAAFPTLRWAKSMNWTDIALKESSIVGRPITAQQIEALQMSLAMARDQYFYIGQIDYKDMTLALETQDTPYGLLNCPYAYKATPLTSTFYEMIQNAGTNNSAALQQIVSALSSVQGAIWHNTGGRVLPNTLLLPLEVYSLLASTVVSQAGNMSIAQYLETNNIYTRTTGKPINIYGVKWLSNQILNPSTVGDTEALTQAKQKTLTSPDWFGNGHLMRAVWYYKGDQYVTYPISDVAKMPVIPQGLTWTTSAWTTIGHIQIAYPETVGYLDGV